MILGGSLILTKGSALWELVKPRITLLVLGTTAVGLFLPPIPPSAELIAWTLLGTALMVGGANTLNMYLERDVDSLMRRTENRPLPAGRLSPRIAFWFGLVLATLSTILLFLKVNLLTGSLGVIAFVAYVFFYTPLKQKSIVALLVGAIPGAIPPLMGWTAATGRIGMPGLILFFILFLWQVPHFLAIALLYKEEYQRAGIKVLPSEWGDHQAKLWIVRYLVGLLAVSLYPFLLGNSGLVYFLTALALGGGFLGTGIMGLKKMTDRGWDRRIFFVSLLYLPVLFTAMLVDR